MRSSSTAERLRRGLRRFLRLPRSAARVRADVDDELRYEIDMRTRELLRDGLSESAARARATTQFGDLEATRRYCEAIDMTIEAEARRTNLISDLRADLAIAWRAMRRAPGFAAVVLATLALGVGANTTVFSVVRRILIAPLPYRAPDRLYRLYTAPAEADGDDDKLSAAVLTTLTAASRSIGEVTLSGNYGSSTYTGDHVAEPWRTAYVALNFFDVLGVKPLAGRQFNDDDLARGAPRVAIISYQLWQRAFGGDRSVIGRHVKLNDIDYTVVGILPAAFVMPEPRFGPLDALQPLNVPAIAATPRMSRGPAWRGIARLRNGVSDAAFRAELPLIRQRIQSQFPDIKNAGVIRPVPLHDAIVGNARTILLLVMFAAAVVLVITCVNIAGLFLSRAAARQRELGVRAALGAGRGRLVRQVLTESAMYGLAGGVLGIALAFVLKAAFLRLAGTTLPTLGDIRIDVGVLLFAAAVSLVCGLAFGFAPAIAATRVDLRDALDAASVRAASQGRSAVRGTRALVSAQVAFAVVLLVGAGLLLRTFVTLSRTNLGYTVDAQTLTFHISLPGARYRQPDARLALLGSLIGRIRSLPGVTSVGYTAVSPWNGGMMNVGLRIEGRPTADAAAPSIQYATASEDFFASIGIPLRAGRVFSATDIRGAPPVAVISESIARRFWPNASPIGARVRLDDGGANADATVLEIVGVVGDIRPSVTADPIATVYVSDQQWGGYGGEFMVRGTGNAAALIPSVRQILGQLDSQLPLLFPRTVRDALLERIARQELAMALMGAFAALALALASLGIYSVMSYMVVARTREFGIRSALGARRETILTLVLRQGLATIVIGVVAGLALATLGSRFVATLLVGVSSHDAITFAVAPIVLTLVAIAACLIPARAATRVDPVEALRAD